jgi:class 3 adenylate cyclase
MEAERRQVTVLFADVVGFTAYSERAGEEAAYNLMRSLSKLVDEAVRENGGGCTELYGRRRDGGFWRALGVRGRPSTGLPSRSIDPTAD